MQPAFRRSEVVVGNLAVLMLRHAVVVWLGPSSYFVRRKSAAITIAFQPFKGVFGHREEVPDLSRKRSIDQYELRAHSKPRSIKEIECHNH